MRLLDVLKLHVKFEGQTHYLDTIELYDAVLDTPPGDVIEIGSACGGTTVVLIEAAKKVNKKVYSIDPYPVEYEGMASNYRQGMMNEFKEKFALNILDGKYDNIIQFNEYLRDCIGKIPDSLSVVFIDGCHEFDFVWEEYELLFPKVVKDGLIYIHDVQAEKGQLSDSVLSGVKKILNWGIGEQISPFMLKIKK